MEARHQPTPLDQLDVRLETTDVRAVKVRQLGPNQTPQAERPDRFGSYMLDSCGHLAKTTGREGFLRRCRSAAERHAQQQFPGGTGSQGLQALFDAQQFVVDHKL